MSHIWSIVWHEIYVFIKPNFADDIFIRVQQQRIFISLLFDPQNLRPRQNWRHFGDDIWKFIMVNENSWICHKISLFFPKGLVIRCTAIGSDNGLAPKGDKPLSESIMA